MNTTNTKSLETMPANNDAAISTPANIDFADCVRKCAKRKADNGAQFSSTKGRTSLTNAVCDMVRSLLGLEKLDSNNNLVPLPDDVFKSIKREIAAFWQNEAVDIVKNALQNDAAITIRRGVLMSRITDKGLIRSKTDRLTSIYKPSASEHVLCDTFGLNAAKNRLDAMLDNVGAYSREQFNAQRNVIKQLESALEESLAARKGTAKGQE